MKPNLRGDLFSDKLHIVGQTVNTRQPTNSGPTKYSHMGMRVGKNLFSRGSRDFIPEQEKDLSSKQRSGVERVATKSCLFYIK